MFAIVAVFIAGLMVGRTPEYLGKKIEAYEVKMASLVLLLPCASCSSARRSRASSRMRLPRSATPGRTASPRSCMRSRSAGNNNGSAFGGLSANNPFYNFALGRRDVDLALLADDPGAGDRRQPGGEAAVAVTAGTLPTHTPLFVSMLVGVVLLIGALTFVPALALGPVVEHLQMIGAR